MIVPESHSSCSIPFKMSFKFQNGSRSVADGTNPDEYKYLSRYSFLLRKLWNLILTNTIPQFSLPNAHCTKLPQHQPVNHDHSADKADGLCTICRKKTCHFCHQSIKFVLAFHVLIMFIRQTKTQCSPPLSSLTYIRGVFPLPRKTDNIGGNINGTVTVPELPTEKK